MNHKSWTLKTAENNEDRKIVWECGLFKIYSTIFLSFGLMFLYFAYLCIVFIFFFDWFLSMPASYLVKKTKKQNTNHRKLSTTARVISMISAAAFRSGERKRTQQTGENLVLRVVDGDGDNFDNLITVILNLFLTTLQSCHVMLFI